MLKIRDLGVHVIPATPPDKAYEYCMFGGETDKCPSSITCPDLSCIADKYRRPSKKKPSKKAPAKKAPAKKAPAKKPTKRGYRASGFGYAAVAQLERQLEEQLRNEQ